MQTSSLNLSGFLNQLRDGHKLYDLVGLVLQLLLVLAGVSLLGVWWRMWSPGFGAGPHFFSWVALLVWQIAWPVAVFLALKALLARASEIRRLPASRYVVAPMVELLLRGFGEAALIASVVLAVPALLAVWFGGAALILHLLPSLPNLVAVVPSLAGPRFWTGIMALVALPAHGLLTLLASYFVAEALIALFAIAEDVRTLRDRGTAVATPEDHG